MKCLRLRIRLLQVTYGRLPVLNSLFRHLGWATFTCSDGLEVEFTVFPGADPEWVQLYLNGQVLVALLHQRKIINFHASSFIYDGRGIMILGETGAGKSITDVVFRAQRCRFSYR